MRGRKKTPAHKCVSRIANDLFAKLKAARLIPSASGACMDCGKRKWLCYDHRDYSDLFAADVVCHGCNEARGPGLVTVIDPETLIHSVLPAYAGAPEQAAA